MEREYECFLTCTEQETQCGLEWSIGHEPSENMQAHITGKQWQGWTRHRIHSDCALEADGPVQETFMHAATHVLFRCRKHVKGSGGCFTPSGPPCGSGNPLQSWRNDLGEPLAFPTNMTIKLGALPQGTLRGTPDLFRQFAVRIRMLHLSVPAIVADDC